MLNETGGRRVPERLFVGGRGGSSKSTVGASGGCSGSGRLVAGGGIVVLVLELDAP